MSYTLLSHQEEGVDFLLSRPGSLLAFEQGLGKSLAAIDGFIRARSTREVEQMLIVCPNSLKRNWVAEIKKFAPYLRTTVIEGPPNKRRALCTTTQTDVYICSYETSRAETTAMVALLCRQPTILVFDESHATKNRTSKTSISAQAYAPYAKFRWLLSGTPVTNKPDDLHTQVGITAGGENPLGPLTSFLDLNSTDRGRQILSPSLDRIVLRRTKEQCLDLPKKIMSDLVVELPPWQRKAYNTMRDSMLAELSGLDGQSYSVFASTALAKLARLKQLATNPNLLTPSKGLVPAKHLALDGVVEEIMSVPGRKLIIWSDYVRSIEALTDRFSQWGARAIYGKVPVSERQNVAREFQEGDEVRIIVANPAAAATGFTLTAADHTIYESLSWRYDFYAQSQDRNHRIGQDKPVTYLRLVAADTIDSAIIIALKRKTVMASSLLGDPLENLNITKFSKDEMVALIRNGSLPE